MCSPAPAAGANGHNGADTIYRARSIDVARDSGADKDRNIVIINNNMAVSTATGAVTSSAVNTITTTGGAYKSIYETLQIGLANTNKQDAYVFAARDGGLPMSACWRHCPSAPTARPSKSIPSSLLPPKRTRLHAGQTQTSKPSASRHRASISIATAIPQESTQRPYPQPPSANAAASLVAGGLALLESIFSGETTARLIDRLLKTASKNYDLNNDDTNDYTLAKHGQGLMDLACAIKPGLSATLSRTGCVDRFATGFGVSSDDIIEVFRGAGNTAETSDLIDSSTFTDSSSTAQKRQREYANQPSLDKVGAAFAYGKAGDGAINIGDAIAKAGVGSNISVVTSKRFDPNHPEFSSAANGATFDTLTQFYVDTRRSDTPPRTLAAVIHAVFGTGDEAKARVQLYRYGFDSGGSAYATIQVPNVGNVTFENISRSAFDVIGNGAVRTALETFLKRVRRWHGSR